MVNEGLDQTEQFFLLQGISLWGAGHRGFIFHLPFGILFTFHSQYTNLNGREAEEEWRNICGTECILRIHHPPNVRYLCRDLIYLLRGIRSINEKLYRDD